MGGVHGSKSSASAGRRGLAGGSATTARPSTAGPGPPADVALLTWQVVLGDVYGVFERGGLLVGAVAGGRCDQDIVALRVCMHRQSGGRAAGGEARWGRLAPEPAGCRLSMRLPHQAGECRLAGWRKQRILPGQATSWATATSSWRQPWSVQARAAARGLTLDRHSLVHRAG